MADYSPSLLGSAADIIISNVMRSSAGAPKHVNKVQTRTEKRWKPQDRHRSISENASKAVWFLSLWVLARPQLPGSQTEVSPAGPSAWPAKVGHGHRPAEIEKPNEAAAV